MSSSLVSAGVSAGSTRQRWGGQGTRKGVEFSATLARPACRPPGPTAGCACAVALVVPLGASRGAVRGTPLGPAAPSTPAVGGRRRLGWVIPSYGVRPRSVETVRPPGRHSRACAAGGLKRQSDSGEIPALSARPRESYCAWGRPPRRAQRPGSQLRELAECEAPAGRRSSQSLGEICR